MDKIQGLSVTIVVVFGIAFLDGIFSWDLADGFYVLLGLIQLVAVVWLLKVVFTKKQ